MNNNLIIVDEYNIGLKEPSCFFNFSSVNFYPRISWHQVSLPKVSCFMGKCWRIQEIQIQNQNFLLFGGRVVQSFLVTLRGSRLHRIILPPSSKLVKSRPKQCYNLLIIYYYCKWFDINNTFCECGFYTIVTVVSGWK